MKKIVFTEEFCRPENLSPFTLTRQMQDLRVGIFTIRQKWENLLRLPSFDKQEGDYKDGADAIELQHLGNDEIIYLIHGNLLPTQELAAAVLQLQPGQFLSLAGGEALVYCISKKEVAGANKIHVHHAVFFKGEVRQIRYPWDLLEHAAWAIEKDLASMQQTTKWASLPLSNQYINKENVYMEAGAQMECCIINASEGPVYIAKGAVVMEGAMLRGPLSIGENAVVKMGAKLYGPSSIGPGCTVGGEVKRSILLQHSNKAHDGYLGDSVIGAWCNLGAGTSNSNIKNTAGNVQILIGGNIVDAGNKCGVLMGDYSRTAINTAINTGTVIGVCCNVFFSGLTPKYIPSFSWGADGMERYRFNEALHHIRAWKALKKEPLSESETLVLAHIFEHF